jgi:TonB family protein
MARRGRGSGFVWLLAALAAIFGALPARAAGGGPAAPAPAVAPPATGAGANFAREDYERGQREAPGILARTGVACTVRQALYEGESNLLDAQGKSVGHGRMYEVACAEGLGYQLILRPKAVPFAVDCIVAAETGKDACMLPLNGHPAGGLDPSLKAAGLQCHALQARYVGQNADSKLRRYEVNCGGGGGYILDLPLADGSGPPPKATPCLQEEDECKLTSHSENVAALAYGVGKRFGEDCRIGEARYVGYVAARDHELYEVSCQAGRDGELIEVDHAGALAGSMDCSKVRLVGAECRLKPGDAADPRIVEAESEGAGRAVITRPDWASRPTAQRVAEYYPLAAQGARVSGRAEIRCRVLASGSLESCSVLDESPAGFGFGAAAVKMARWFQMRPKTLDGKPVAGGDVVIPINFGIRPF